jgi:hypothetical protein
MGKRKEAGTEKHLSDTVDLKAALLIALALAAQLLRHVKTLDI